MLTQISSQLTLVLPQLSFSSSTTAHWLNRWILSAICSHSLRELHLINLDLVAAHWSSINTSQFCFANLQALPLPLNNFVFDLFPGPFQLHKCDADCYLCALQLQFSDQCNQLIDTAIAHYPFHMSFEAQNAESPSINRFFHGRWPQWKRQQQWTP